MKHTMSGLFLAGILIWVDVLSSRDQFLHTWRRPAEAGGYMRRFRGSKSILFLLLAGSAVRISSAASVDQKLLFLVPPGALTVSRISAPSGQGKHEQFRRDDARQQH